jgi:uncharacterized protein (DUF1697 family)
MATQIALLRAVNLGSHNKISMADLRALAEGLGLASPRTLLQSGNLVFESDAPAPKNEAALERAAKKTLGLDTDFFVRTAAEWRALVAGNPFPREAEDDPAHVVAIVLKEPPARAAVAALEHALKGRERVAVKGKVAYAVYPDGIGRSKLTAAVIDRSLRTPGTARNWNTVTKLAELARPAR